MTGYHLLDAILYKDPVEIAIASGVLTATQNYIIVDGEGGVNDDLDTITLSADFNKTFGVDTYRGLLMLKAKAGVTITVKNGTGNIDCTSDITLSGDTVLLAVEHGATWGIVGSAGGGGGGSMNSFNLAGDTGTPQSISDGNTATIAGGTGLSSVASATDTVTLNLDDTAVTPGSYTAADITVDQQGRITAAASGSVGMIDFDVAADTGTPETVADGATLTIAGGDGIDTSVAAPDTVSIAVDSTVARLDAVQTLTNKTLTTPTIASFANAGHDHEDAAGGGTLASPATPTALHDDVAGEIAAVSLKASPTSSDLLLIEDAADSNAKKRVTIGTLPASAPARYRSGLTVRRLADATVLVGVGEITVNGTLVEKTTQTSLGMATGADWIGGSSNEAASQFVHIYVDASGNIKLHNKAPNYPRPDAASRVFVALVNQAGWNGTAGNGLNATSVVYDNDTGDTNIVAGMLLGVYGSADADYGTGRGKGSAAGASVAHSSWARITAVDTGTNTLTLEAGHQIAINDNDRLIAIEAGALEYRQEAGAWWRWLGALYNDGSSNLTDNDGRRAIANVNEGANYTTASGTMADIDSTDLTLQTFFPSAGMFRAAFAGSVSHSTTGITSLDLAVDTVAYAGNAGFAQVRPSSNDGVLGFNALIPTLPGTHAIAPQWRTSAATATMYAGAGTTDRDTHPQLNYEFVG